MPEDRTETLRQARERTLSVLADLQAHQAELESNPHANLPADQIEAGRAALKDAVLSAQRTLAVLDKLLAGGENPRNTP